MIQGRGARALQAQPFRKVDSEKTPHGSEQVMLSQMANAIADMD